MAAAPNDPIGGVGGGFNAPSFIAQLGFSYLLGRYMAEDGPRISNLEVTSGEYGVPMPRVYGGAARLGLPIMAADKIKETEHEVEDYSEVVGAISGAAQGFAMGGPVGAVIGAGVGFLSGLFAPDQKYYTYSITMALLLADRTGQDPIEGLNRMWSQGRIIFNTAEQGPTSTTLDGDGNLIMRQYGKNKYIGRIRVYGGGFDQTPDSILEGILGDQPGYRGTAYVVLEDFQLEYFGNSVPPVEGLVAGKTGETLADFLSHVGNVAGIDVTRHYSSALMSNVVLGGYAVKESINCWDAVKPLQPIYSFDSAEIAGVVSFFPRGNGWRATVPLEHMGAHEWGSSPQERIRFSRPDDTSLPKETNLTFVDPGREYQANTVSSQRVLGDANSINNVTLGITLPVDEAASACSLMHWDAWLGRTGLAYEVDDAWIGIQPGVTYAIPVGDYYAPYRVTVRRRGPNGITEVEAISDESIVYDAAEIGSSGTVDGGSTLLPETVVVPMDMPITQDDHDDYGFYVAMGASSDNWVRGAVYVSSDGVTYAKLLDHTQSAVMGDVSGTLAAGTTDGLDDTLDTTTVLTVVLLHDEMTLTSKTDAQLDNWENFAYVGIDGVGEYLQFKTATKIAPATWELTNLRRGRRGTDHHIGSHVANEQFVLIGEGGIYRIPVNDDTGWGDMLYFKGVSLYEDEADVATVVDFTNLGEGKRPFSPIELEGTWSSGDLALTWTDRERFFDAANSTDLPATYELDFYEGAVLRGTAVGITTTSFDYTAAAQVSDGFDLGDIITVHLYRVNDTYGRSRARIASFQDPTYVYVQLEDGSTVALMEDDTTEIEMG